MHPRVALLLETDELDHLVERRVAPGSSRGRARPSPRTVRYGSTPVDCSTIPIRSLRVVVPLAGSCPRTRTSPAVRARNPSRISDVVVLPAPFGPRSANTSPASTWKSIAPDGLEVAVGLAQPAHLDRRRPWATTYGGGSQRQRRRRSSGAVPEPLVDDVAQRSALERTLEVVEEHVDDGDLPPRRRRPTCAGTTITFGMLPERMLVRERLLLEHIEGRARDPVRRRAPGRAPRSSTVAPRPTLTKRADRLHRRERAVVEQVARPCGERHAFEHVVGLGERIEQLRRWPRMRANGSSGSRAERPTASTSMPIARASAPAARPIGPGPTTTSRVPGQRARCTGGPNVSRPCRERRREILRERDDEPQHGLGDGLVERRRARSSRPRRSPRARGTGAGRRPPTPRDPAELAAPPPMPPGSRSSRYVPAEDDARPLADRARSSSSESA